MLKALLLPLMTLAPAAMATAQTNLVPNPSFEDTLSCNTFTQCTLLKAEHWRNPNLATPDVFDCDLSRECGITMDPTSVNNPPGYYRPAYQGQRFAGGYFWYGTGSSNTREYLMVQLSESLLVGQAYEVGLHYVLPTSYRYAVDHIGVWFGPDSLFASTSWWLPVSPQLRLRPTGGGFVQSPDWAELADTLHAQGGERWMIIGNFEEAADVVGATVNPDGLDPHAFYFIDQIRVVPLTQGQSVPDLVGGWQANLLWLRWPANLKPDAILLADMAGRIVLETSNGFEDTSGRWELPNLAQGAYIASADFGSHHVVVKVIKGAGAP